VSDLDDAIANERKESGGDDPKAEARRAKDRERKARSRAAASGGEAPPARAPRARAEKSSDKELDPRVVRAVKACLDSMMMEEITPEFEREMSAAMAGALQYEIEERLPMLSDEFAPEIGLGTAIVGTGVTKFRSRRKRDRDRKKAEAGHVGIPDVPPDPTAPAAPPSTVTAVAATDDDPFTALGLDEENKKTESRNAA
jgi:hypothetical protein